MLTDAECVAWARSTKLDGEAVDLVTTIRTSEPRRRVRSGRQNVSGRYPSGKMLRTIQFESHTVELPFIYQFEHDDDILEYWDQPAVPVKVAYRDSRTGRKVGALHTADFFVVTASSAGWAECKTESELLRLASKSDRYRRGSEGWECPSGSEFAQRYGLTYRVLTSALNNPTLIGNLRLLEDYYRHPAPVPDDVASRLVNAVSREPGIDLAELRQATGADADAVNQLLADRTLFINLEQSPLTRPASCRVFLSREQARGAVASAARLPAAALPRPLVMNVGARVEWDGAGWEIVNAGREKLALRSTAGDGVLVELGRDQAAELAHRGSLVGVCTGAVEARAERLAQASPGALAIANRRWAAVNAHRQGQRAEGVAGRTLRRWLAAFRAAEAAGSSGFDGLLPVRRSGNTHARLDPRIEALITDLARDHWTSSVAPSMQSIYARLAAACAERGLVIPSQRTLRRRLRSSTGHAARAVRQGPKGAYGWEPFHWTLEGTTPRHGERPFEIGHIDHTQLDVEVVDRDTGRGLGRPWVTFVNDAYSRRLLAIWLAFEPPSYRAAMMVIRICVARHHRLPETLVVDGGAEFHSVYFESLLARLEVTLKTRPAGKPRYGSTLERLFGSANTGLLHQLAGNTKVMRNVRAVTPDVNPRRLATWDLASLYETLCRWGYEVYDTLDHPALGQSPRDAFVTGLDRHGHREQRTIAYDDAFVLSTLPTTAKGTATIDSVRGVRINYVSYWNEIFAEPRLAGTAVPVRFDPFDARHAFAYAGGQWVEATAGDLYRMPPMATTEVVMASAELRRQRGLHAGGGRERAVRIGQFLASTDAANWLADVRSRGAAGREVLRVAEGNTPPIVAPPPVVDRAVLDVREDAEPDSVTIYQSYR